MHKPPVIILSSPSGCGKSTVNSYIEENNYAPTACVVTCTSRAPRVNDGVMEQDGREYYFWSREEFEANIAKGEMLEYAEYPTPTLEKPEPGNYYGSTWKELERIKSLGRVPIYIVEVQGVETLSEKLKEKYRVVTLFLLPPSMEELENRLRGRGSEDEEKIQKRLKTAEKELDFQNKYDIRLVNNDSRQTAATVGRLVGEVMANVPMELLKNHYDQDIKKDHLIIV
jgi:guanylate kinase